MNISELGEEAKRDYKTVKYFPFGNEGGSPFILTSDPFSYLNAWLDSKLREIHRDRGEKRNSFTKAKYFSHLSEGFYKSSRAADMPSKGTLLYYALINLVKVYLIIEGYELETKLEHHGLSLPSNATTSLKLSKLNDDGISIFHEFAKTIGRPINNADGLELTFETILRNLPEVHEIGFALDSFPNSKRKFLPVDLIIRTNEKRNKLFYTVAYEKKFDKQMKTDRLTKGDIKKVISPIDVDDVSKKYFRSIRNFNYTCGSQKSWKMAYPKLVHDLSELHIACVLTRNGYRTYLDLEPDRLHRLSYVLAFAYYIGTVARYRPTLNESILKGKYQTIITEAISSCPSQFFYLLISHITKQVCAIPMAKLE